MEINMFNHVVFFVLIISLILFIPYYISAEQSEKSDKSENAEEKVAALINGKKILLSTLEKEMQAAIASNPQLQTNADEATKKMIKEQILNSLVEQELLIQAGKNAGFTPETSEIDAELANMKAKFPSEDIYQQILKQEKLTEKELKNQIEERLIAGEFVEKEIRPKAKSVTDEEVSKFYEENKEKFVEPEKVKASHILVKVEPNADEKQKADAKKKIEDILKKVKKGEDFAELAKENSDCDSAEKGGDLGYFAQGQMLGPFSKAAFNLEPGKISDIVETQYGYHIIKVADKKAERKVEFDEVKEKIKKYLTEKEVMNAMDNWFKSAKEKADISIMLEGK
ncbi:peptidylprolyl isomerase [Candidatus Poribacteria bacterium]|nr:peptidylprolyl isomerase [Candidatus Poribacteria bacterium]